jgi:hypothetical protein
MPSIENIAGTAAAEVDPSFSAVRMSLRPMEATGWHSVGLLTGALTGIAANAAIFSFRNISANPILVRRIGVGFITTTAFTAAQMVQYGVKVARAFTASDTLGTAIALTGSNTKLRTALAVPTSVDCRISAAAALGAGTKTLDPNDIGTAIGFAGGVGQGITPALNNLFAHDTGDHPLTLVQNEGFNIMNLLLMGAAGVGTAVINFEFAEATDY